MGTKIKVKDLGKTEIAIKPENVWFDENGNVESVEIDNETILITAQK